ncbi:T9SS type A sorting domain-containing protein [Flavobacterium sp. NRK1]|uniref:DUF7619 domain-containing protein n=1 Tax=Flavobacterium sp. NRK1 TaxID=2954929 RepID=UPI0020939086|nr:T9SS type A sorting domain-containing protein [Flavobacterium sp. NRK1]MCO6146917.1 T9SS type A sorting domain-containing protein [Flavobacterium sp. NRK1]
MRNTLLYLLLLFSGGLLAQEIVVPDAAFKAKLLEASAINNIAKNSSGDAIAVDANGNGVITEEEAEDVRELNVASSEIYSLTGIAYFSNLRVLDCSHNTIVNLDVTSLEDLRELRCTNNTMITLNAAGLTHLELLDCSVNNIASLNLDGLDSLKNLNTYINALNALDLSDLEYLEDLNCDSNNLSELNVSSLVNLTSLNCSNNQLTTLDLSSNINLESLTCFSNNLVTLFIKNGKNESFDPANWMENPDLEYICADESQIASILASESFPDNVQVNSYCSYEPGGIYNRITGTVRFDSENNGCDAADYAIPSFKLTITSGGYEDSVFTKPDGTYTFYVGAGSYTVTPEFENTYFYASPSTGYTSFETVNGATETRNFCIMANGVHNDVEVLIAPVTNAQPGFDAVYKMVYKNKGNQVIDAGDITCYWDSSRLEYVNMQPVADIIGTDIYTWNYTSLKPFESREISMTLNVNTPTDTPSVNIGDELHFGVEINPETDDEPQDNSFEFNQIVTGSYDPNNIICIEGSNISPDAIGDYLHYIVNFENTGTSEASFIVVQQDINPDEFDIASLRLINNSHGVTTRTIENRIEFRFDNINLGVADHGNILYKIKSKHNLTSGDMVSGKANIYFDYNFPVATNSATTTFDVLSTEDFEKDNSVIVYPNPSKDVVKIEADSVIKSVQLYDIQGRLLQIGVVNETSVLFDITNRASGIYFLKINTEKGIKVEKLIRE